MILDWQTYVLQRRISRPSEHVLRAIANPALFGPGMFLTDDAQGAFVLDERFHRVDAYAVPVWRAVGRLLDSRRRSLGGVEIEISAWSALDTQLLIRPRARRPERWSGRRTRSYFACAHRSADGFVRLLADTPAAPDLDREARQSLDDARR
ncbi:MAG: hypothetical protein QOF59_2263 [Actinomycetota bacterium]|nr:hypothetical protein [Actinomycetota bacterium]